MKYLLKAFLLPVLALPLSSCSVCFCDHYLFSAINGIVTQAGKPLVHVEVEQSFFSSMHDRRGRLVVATDTQGKFYFPPITQYATVERMHTPSVQQTIKIRHQGEEYVGWSHEKRNYDREGDTGGKVELDCDLTLPDTDKGVRGENVVRGICNFN